MHMGGPVWPPFLLISISIQPKLQDMLKLISLLAFTAFPLYAESKFSAPNQLPAQ